MKNFGLPKTKLTSGYTWIQGYTGFANVRNRFDSSASFGAIIHLSYHHWIWIQESYNKVVTVLWYTPQASVTPTAGNCLGILIVVRVFRGAKGSKIPSHSEENFRRQT